MTYLSVILRYLDARLGCNVAGIARHPLHLQQRLSHFPWLNKRSSRVLQEGGSEQFLR